MSALLGRLVAAHALPIAPVVWLAGFCVFVAELALRAFELGAKAA